MKEKLIHLGSCGRPHGIAGGFSASLFNPEDSAIKKGLSLILRPKRQDSSVNPDGQAFTVIKANLGNKAILYLEGVTHRNEAEAMVPFDIYIKREDLPATNKNEFYIEDLIGLKVLGEDGEKLGIVKNYFDNGAQLVLVVEKSDGEIELPFVEAFFPEVDVKAGFIKMIEPEII